MTVIEGLSGVEEQEEEEKRKKGQQWKKSQAGDIAQMV
jgi:hypothetical protein